MGTDEKSMLLDKNDPNQQGGVGVSWLLVVAVAVAIYRLRYRCYRRLSNKNGTVIC